MNYGFQVKMVCFSVLFFLFITYMVRKKKLQVKQSLKWYFASVVFIIMSIFPKILFGVSKWFGIIEPTNAVFLIVIAFMLLIMFINNITISKNQEDITRLVQELSILKAKMKETKDDIRVVDNAVRSDGDRTDTMEI